MTDALCYSSSSRALFSGARRFDPWSLVWKEAIEVPADAVAVGCVDAVRRVFRDGRARRVPIAVIGPREASASEYATAEALGFRLGELGLTVICGGKAGVMEAVCKGCLDAGGQPIGLLPEDEWNAANPYVAVPIATGLGKARNAIIAQAAVALIAVGGGYGTLTEMAYGLHFERLVLALGAAPPVDGVVRCAEPEEAVERVARRVLALG